MSENSEYNAFNINAVIVSKLSIERCQSHLAHLHALMYLREHGESKTDDLVSESVLQVMEQMGRELAHSSRALSVFG